MCTALQHFQKVLLGGLRAFLGKEERVETEEEGEKENVCLFLADSDS